MTGDLHLSDIFGGLSAAAESQIQQSSNWAYEEGICVERTPNEWIVFKVACANSSILSIVGSSLIIFMVFRGRAGLSRLQNRVLVPMSIFDIIGSIGFGFSTTLIPRGSNCTYGAMGTQGTCTMQGILISLGLIVPSYNAVLCVYYLMVIKHNVRDDIIVKYEPYMHFAAIFPSLVITIITASANRFNNYSIACWLSERDRYDEHQHGENASPLLVGIYLSVLFFACLVVGVMIYCMVQVYRFVRERERRMSTYRFPRPDRINGGTRPSNLSNVVDDTKKQAFLYVGSFFLTYLFTTLMLLFDAFLDTPLPYPFMLLHGLFGPLQGFWNFMAYIRPRYILVSREHREKSFLQRLQITVFQQQSHQPSTRRALREHQRLRERRREGWRERLRKRRKEKKKSKKKAEQRPGSGSPSPQSLENKENIPMNSQSPSTRCPALDGTSHHMIVDLDLEEGKSASTDNFRDNSSKSRRNSRMRYRDYSSDSPTSDYDDNEYGSPDSSPVDLRDYREAVSLSLLVAQDILPPYHSHNHEYRRRSMLEYFHGDSGAEVQTNSTEALSANEGSNSRRVDESNYGSEKLFNLTDQHRKYRRHSCPSLASAQKSFLQEFDK